MPVLVTAFNRPDLLAARLDELRAAHDGPLFVAVDGPRDGSVSDAVAVRECLSLARQEAQTRPVQIRERDANLGCREAMIDGISWFMAAVGEGAIIEDDIRIGPAFLPFAARLLDLHRADADVGMISGYPHSMRTDGVEGSPPYFFSWLGSIWGWATWADRWQALDETRKELHRAPSTLRLLAATRSLAAARRTRRVALWAVQGVNSWAFWWDMARVTRGLLTATAAVPLVQHLAADDRATHTAGEGAGPEPQHIRPPVRPQPLVADRAADRAAATALGADGFDLRFELPPEVVRLAVSVRRLGRRRFRASADPGSD